MSVLATEYAQADATYVVKTAVREFYRLLLFSLTDILTGACPDVFCVQNSQR